MLRSYQISKILLRFIVLGDYDYTVCEILRLGIHNLAFSHNLMKYITSEIFMVLPLVVNIDAIQGGLRTPYSGGWVNLPTPTSF